MNDVRAVLDEAIPGTRFRACVYAAPVGWDVLLYDSGQCEWAGRLLPPVARSEHAATWRWGSTIGTMHSSSAWMHRLTRWLVAELERVGVT